MTLPVAADEIEVRRPFFLKPLPFQVGSRRVTRCHGAPTVAIYTDARQTFLLGTIMKGASQAIDAEKTALFTQHAGMPTVSLAIIHIIGGRKRLGEIY